MMTDLIVALLCAWGLGALVGFGLGLRLGLKEGPR